MKKTNILLAASTVFLAFIFSQSCGKNTPSEPPFNTATITPTSTGADTSTITVTPTPTVSPTSTAINTPVFMGFDTGIGGWAPRDESFSNHLAIYEAEWDASDGYGADGCISASAAFDVNSNTWTAEYRKAGTLWLELAEPVSIESHTLSVWVKVPAELAMSPANYAVRIGAMEYGIWAQSPPVELTSTGWIQVSCPAEGLEDFGINFSAVEYLFIHVFRLPANETDPSYDVPHAVIKFDNFVY